MDERVPESALMQGAAGSRNRPCAHHRDGHGVLPFSANGGSEGKEESHLTQRPGTHCLPMVGTDLRIQFGLQNQKQNQKRSMKGKSKPKTKTTKIEAS